MSDIVIRAVTSASPVIKATVSASPVIKPSNAVGPQGIPGPKGENGDVVGPSTSVGDNFASWDGTGGNTLKDSGSKASDFATASHNHSGTYLESVVGDTTPQLGGNLDVNGKVITSASNGAVEITPNGTGMLKLGKGAYFSDYIDNGTAAATIDWRLSNKQLIRPDGNRAYTFTAPAGVTSLTLVITVGASRTLTWPATVSWRGGAPSTTAAGTYIATFFWDGTNYFGTCTGKD